MARDKEPKITVFDIMFREPIKRFAGIQNSDGSVGKVKKYSKELERNMANYEMQKNAFILEQSKVIAEAIKNGRNSYEDFQFALQKVKYKIKDTTGKEIEQYGYHYLAYLEKLLEANQKNGSNLRKITENDYHVVTNLQRAIEQLEKQYDEIDSQKRRLDHSVERFSPKKK